MTTQMNDFDLIYRCETSNGCRRRKFELLSIKSVPIIKPKAPISLFTTHHSPLAQHK